MSHALVVILLLPLPLTCHPLHIARTQHTGVAPAVFVPLPPLKDKGDGLKTSVGVHIKATCSNSGRLLHSG